MLEFKSQPQKSFSPAMLWISAGVLVVLLAAVYFFVRFQGSAPRAGSSGVVVEGLLRAGDTNFEYYKTRVKIENVKAVLGISFNNARIATISGTLVNDGDRKLHAVELHVTLFDMWGKVSKERTAFALRPGKGLTNKPMQPLERRAFTIGVESVEYYWDPKQISYEITGLKFE